MSQNEYNSLFNRYKMYSEDELKNITVANGYTEIAEKVANDILQSDRQDYNLKLQQDLLQNEREKICGQKEKEKNDARENHPLYDDIHQIAKDIHFCKTVVLNGIIITVILYIVGVLYTVLK